MSAESVSPLPGIGRGKLEPLPQFAPVKFVLDGGSPKVDSSGDSRIMKLQRRFDLQLAGAI